MHNRQAEITVLAVYGLVVCVVGLAAVFTGTDKPAAEGVPIVQENGGLPVYQVLGGTNAAVPPKRVERQFGDVALLDDRTVALLCGRITGTPKQAVSGKAFAGCIKAFCRITATSAGSIPKLSMTGCKVAGRSQKQPAPSGRQYT